MLTDVCRNAFLVELLTFLIEQDEPDLLSFYFFYFLVLHSSLLSTLEAIVSLHSLNFPADEEIGKDAAD